MSDHKTIEDAKEESRRAEAEAEEIVTAIAAADLCCPEQVADIVLAAADRGEEWEPVLAGYIARDPAERRVMGIK